MKRRFETMESVLDNGFQELAVNEILLVSGGGWSDFFEKISPMSVGEFIYQAGQDFGASGVKFGRECYDFYDDLRKIWG